MNYEQARKAIQGFFSSNFTALNANKIAWDNVAFQIPKTKEAWIRFSIQNNISGYKSFGKSKLTRREGIIFIQIFTPENTETLQASQLTDSITSIFETKLLGGVTFQSPDAREAGISEGWFQINISVPFYFDSITTYS
ncbi:hypothetical protein EKK58_10255 [Candidatus Dependentiae bacterium]|nr:MAG: hypothetical protein EKK58_10255 [Candidatus Dependentiae bacterium]